MNASGDSHELQAPTGKSKTWLLRFIAGYLLLQLLLPVSYYLRDDPYDERFAWRMFSPIRQHQCRTVAHETMVGSGPRTIGLERELHVAWSNMLGRNRRPVIHQFLRERCERPATAKVELINRCRETSGETLAPQRYELDCESGALTEPERYIVPREER